MSQIRNFKMTASLLALVAAGMAQPATSAACSWNGGTGQWTPAGGWTGCAVPGSADSVSISVAGSVVNITNATASAGTIDLAATNQLNLSNSDLLIYNNAVTNNGTINITNGSNLRSGSGTVTIGGTGSIVLGDQNNNRIYGGGFVFGSGQTVRGGGSIGINQTIITNNGLISADNATRSLDIDVSGGNGGVGPGNGVGPGTNAGLYNTGTMQATGGATLNIGGGLYENSAAGVIKALAGSVVALNADSRIVGGTLTSVGTGRIKAVGTTQYLTNVTLSSGSNLEVQNDNLWVNTSLVNNGTITIGGTTGTADLRAENALTISGSGIIVLDNSLGAARIYGSPITFGSNQSLRGAGQLGINQTIVTNNGVFSANSGSNLSIDVTGGSGGVGNGNGTGTNGASGLFNNNIIEATGGSSISFEGGLYENASGAIIRATNNSLVLLNGDSRIVNGTLTSDVTSQINAHGTTQYLTNVTLSSGSNLSVRNDDLWANTSLVNNGTITIGGTAGTSNLRAESAVLTITGTGIIVLDNSAGAARIYQNQIVFGSNQSLRGAGQLGINQTIVTNNGVFSANSGSNLSIDVGGGNGGVGNGNGVGTNGASGLLNNNIIEATGGSSISFEGGLYENANGAIIRATNGSTVALNGDSRILNGTLSSDATSQIDAVGTVQYLTNVTLSAGSRLNVRNDYLFANTSLVNNGTITIGGTAGTADLRAESAVLTISGTGTIVLDNSVNAARIYQNHIVFGSNQSLRGAGQLGINQTIVTNNGVFSANSGSNLSIDVSGGNGGVGNGNGTGTNLASGLLNNNIIEATGGSSISFEGGLYENASGAIIRATNGSTVALNGDSRILNGTLTSDATSQINAYGTVQYLTNVTLSTGSKLNVRNDYLFVNTSLVNNGTIALGGTAGTVDLRAESAVLTISGTGTIILDNSVNATRIYQNRIDFGAGQTVRGSGSIGINQLVVTNDGLISADAGTGISIDVTAGSGGTGNGNGVGTNGASGLFNTGTIQSNGTNLGLEGGRYENSATGSFVARAGAAFSMNNDASLFNLVAGGVLDKGNYRSIDGTLNLRSNAANSVTTIGTASAGTDTVMTLSGSGSTINVIHFVSGAPVSIDSTLATVAQSGRLEVLNGRNLTIVANAGAFNNHGIVQLGGGSFGATSFTNAATAETYGFGAVTVAIANSGSVRANGGTLATRSINGTGAVTIDNGAMLDISAGAGNSSAATLANNGALALGGNSITVANDYTNAAFGTGNAFNGRANVTGAGLILAASATQVVTAAGLTGNTLDLGNIRIGGATSTTLTVTNNGTQTTLRGAVQNGSAPGVTLGTPDFVIGPNGGSANVAVNFAGITPGSLAGQSISVVNNFDNVANSLINLQGGAFNMAVGTVTPVTLNLGNFRVGSTASGAISINNTAPAGPFSESLAVTGTGTSGGATVSGVTNGLILAGGSSGATVGMSTATTGTQSGTVSFSFATDGTGTSGLAQQAIAGANVAVSANIFALANPFIASPLQFGNVLQGSVQTRTLTVENRLLPGVLAAFQEGLNAGFGLLTGDVQSAAGTITNLAANTTDTTTLTVTLNTVSAGAKTGTVEILLQSNGTGTSGLGNLDLAPQTISVLGQVDTSGNVYRLAQAGLTPTSVAFGSRRVGDAAPAAQILTITNTAANDGYSESLDAASGATTGRATVAGGPVSLLAAGSSSTAISVGVNTAVAGANGTVTINFASNGAGTSGLGITALPSQTVTLGGGVYQAAIAGAQPASLTLAARRVGDVAASSTLTITNTAPGTGGYTESLSANVAANNGFLTNGGGAVTTADLGVGGSQGVGVSIGTATAGSFAGTVSVANTSVAISGSGLTDLALAGQSVAVNAKVYAAAVANLGATNVDFGVVRQGAANPTGSVTVTNGAVGALTDTLVTTLAGTPVGVSGAAPGPLAAGASGNAVFSLNTASAGVVSGNGSLDFVSHDADLADLTLASQAITFTGTVTELAVGQLFSNGGGGSFSGSGSAYTLNFGSFVAGSGSTQHDIGVLNNILSSAFSETLGGSFAGASANGFSFGPNTFTGLAGGASDTGNVLSFDYTGLLAGNYSQIYNFNGISSFTGLPDYLLGPIQLTVNARVTSGTPGVPEPAIWAQLIVGFGVVGGFARRRRALAKRAAAC